MCVYNHNHFENYVFNNNFIIWNRKINYNARPISRRFRFFPGLWMWQFFTVYLHWKQISELKKWKYSTLLTKITLYKDMIYMTTVDGSWQLKNAWKILFIFCKEKEKMKENVCYYHALLFHRTVDCSNSLSQF